ncbi:uncharacterized protein BO88DRAFT_411149 [Aspergillus vadensis CBS 113365]|uniref:Uncharacterized protein n=1 Tax=Aspergillus vadensis (strain CBS 113365 / IMI 142717 / IBT 24658) TaxID=1448311 RepID=A0A319BKL6_ASPVC|nr:hypothetical protein BO88DRAFT_411149 [Aspergillus vadensis CBS 113365]PYH73756.1 hypothetical protein BO88DRAFT_411149 [Aspergillus vadensis CBS 113365]
MTRKIHKLLPWTLADLCDNVLLEYGAQRACVASAAVASSFEDYVNDLLRLIDDAFNLDEVDVADSVPGSSLDNPLIVTDASIFSGHRPVAYSGRGGSGRGDASARSGRRPSSRS